MHDAKNCLVERYVPHGMDIFEMFADLSYAGVLAVLVAVNTAPILMPPTWIILSSFEIVPDLLPSGVLNLEYTLGACCFQNFHMCGLANRSLLSLTSTPHFTDANKTTTAIPTMSATNIPISLSSNRSKNGKRTI